jgi:hypothetical protein
MFPVVLGSEVTHLAVWTRFVTEVKVPAGHQGGISLSAGAGSPAPIHLTKPRTGYWMDVGSGPPVNSTIVGGWT